MLRQTHPIPKVDDTLAQLAGTALFSKLDTNSGFWQIPLAEDSCKLTTSLWLFQKRMSSVLEGLSGTVCLMDHVLVFGANQAEHGARLPAALERVQAAGVTLNPNKCEFGKSSIKFLGHIIDESGIRAYPEKTSAICKMEAPRCISDLRRFMGMINQLGKFSPNPAELS